MLNVVYAECRQMSFMRSVTNNLLMLSVIMLKVIMLIVIMLKVIMLNVIMLSVVMLNVVVPLKEVALTSGQ